MFDSIEPLNPDYLTHKGDVVVRMTIPYTAVLISEEFEGYVIPSSFVVIRANGGYLLPEYLYWLLNAQQTRSQIYEGAVSNMLGAVKPRYFADFEVEDLPLEQQHIIAELNRLAHRENQLLLKLAAEKEKYYNQMIHQVYKEMKRGN